MVAPITDAVVCTPPARAYQDEAQLAAERTAIFRRSWLVAGLAVDVAAPGSYLSTELAGMPVLVSRDRAGVLHAMANVCQHRGMIIASGSGSTRTFNCPNHAWVYDLDGQLRGAPRATREADFDCSAIRLPRFAVHEWGPIVLVNQDPDAAPPSAELSVVDEVLAAAGLDAAGMRPVGDPIEWSIASNWKIVVENYLECYHCSWVHRDLATVLDVASEKYALGRSGRLLRASSPVRSTSNPAAQQALLDTAGPMTNSHWFLLYPSTTINLYPGRGAMELTWYLPGGPGTTIAYTAVYGAPGASSHYADQVMALLTRVGEEDNSICEAMHRGMASGALERERVLPENEALITDFHALLDGDLVLPEP